MAAEARYACLQETNEEEGESWMYFLKYDGNEEAIKHLSEQLESVEFYLIPGLSTFDIDIEHLVSATTAKQVTKLELNTHWHRKFDGKLKMVDLELEAVERKCKKKGKDQERCNEKKMEKLYDILGEGGIENFIDEEDIDPEDRADGDEPSESESESESDEELTVSPPRRVVQKLPESTIPKNLKAKAHRQRTQKDD